MPSSLSGCRVGLGGVVSARWLQIVAVIVLLLTTAFLAWNRRPAASSAPEADGEPSVGERSREYLPLAEGNQWRYRSTITDRRRGTVRQQDVVETVAREEDGGFRIIAEVDGRQQDNRLAIPTPDGVRMREYETDRDTVLFLPPGDLTPGCSWDMTDRRRARVVSVESSRVGTEDVDAVKIRLERFYDREETEDPAWLLQGHFWVARGIGVVRRDSSGAQRPQVLEGRMTAPGPDPEIETIVELQSYKLKSGAHASTGGKGDAN